MKRQFLTDLGIEGDNLEKIMSEYGKGVQAAKDSANQAAQTQIDEIQGKLKEFDGVDIAEMNSKIEKLTNDLSLAKEKHKAELADRDFNGYLDSAIRAAGGRNERAVKALLDLEGLKKSKNQKEDIAQAVAAVQESDTYLFNITDATSQEDTTQTATTPMSTGGTHMSEQGGVSDPMFDSFKKAMGVE